MKRIVPVVLVIVSVFAGAAPALAHHAPTAYAADFTAQIEHGDAHLAANEFPQAIEAYRRAAGAAPEAWSAAYRVGLAHYRWAERVPARRDWALDEAAEAAAEATTLEPTAVEAWRLLGAAEYARGRTEDAYRAFKIAARLRGGDAGILCDLAIAASGVGRLEEAARVLQEARDLGTDPGRVVRTANALGVTTEGR